MELMERIPDDVFEQFLWLLVKYDCPYALLFIAHQAELAGMSAKDFLRGILEKGLLEIEGRGGETQTETQGTQKAL